MSGIRSFILVVISVVCFPWIFLITVGIASKIHSGIEFDPSPVCDAQNRIINAYMSPLCAIGEGSSSKCYDLSRSNYNLDASILEAGRRAGIDDETTQAIYKAFRPAEGHVEAETYTICGPGENAEENLRAVFPLNGGRQ